MILAKFTIHNNYVEVEISKECTSNQYSGIYSTIYNVCTKFYTAFFKMKWQKIATATDKEITLFRKNQFPTGLFWEVYDRLERFYGEDSFQIIDKRFQREKLKKFKTYFPFKLDLKQQEAAKIGLESKRGYFKIATGGGKTALMAELIANLGGKSLVLVPSIDLTNQISKDLEAFIPIARLDKVRGGESIKTVQNDITVASISTLGANFEQIISTKWLDQFDNLLMDEVHHTNMIGKSNALSAYYNVGINCNAFNRFGFTATDKGKEIFIKAVTGGYLIEVDEDYLINSDRLSKPYFVIFKHNLPFELDLRKTYHDSIHTNSYRNQILINVAFTVAASSGSCLIMLDSKSIQMQEILRLSGNSIPYISGETKSSEREILYKKLENKEIPILMLTVGKEGLNIPSVDAIIRAGAIKSQTRVKQETGRGLRKTADKSRVLIFDFYDDDGSQMLRKEGFEDVFYTKIGFLRKHSKERISMYKSVTYGELIIIEDEVKLYKKVTEIINKKD